METRGTPKKTLNHTQRDQSFLRSPLKDVNTLFPLLQRPEGMIKMNMTPRMGTFRFSQEGFFQSLPKQEEKRTKIKSLLYRSVVLPIEYKKQTSTVESEAELKARVSRFRKIMGYNKSLKTMIIPVGDGKKKLPSKRWKIWRSRNSLQKLKIHFGWFQGLNKETLPSLLNRLRVFTGLKELSLENCRFRESRAFGHLSLCFKNLKNLQRLRVDFPDKIIRYIFPTLRYLPNLRRLQIHATRMPERDFERLRHAFRGCAYSLRELHLLFVWWEGDKKLLDLERILCCCPQLQDFSLTTECTALDKQGFSDLCKILKTLHSLKCLRLKIFSPDASLEDLKDLCLSNESLEEVKLCLSGCQSLKNDQVTNFMQSVKLIPRQMKFEFEFFRCEITEADLRELWLWGSMIPKKKFVFSLRK